MEQGVQIPEIGSGFLQSSNTRFVEVSQGGNYLVELEIKANKEIRDGVIFAGRRRMVWRGSLEKDRRMTIRYVTNLSPIIPCGYQQPMEHTNIAVTLTDEGMELVQLQYEPWQGRTVYLAGDSTVTDQSAEYPYDPSFCYCGWGQVLPCFIGEQMAVSNHAHSGLSTESFREDGHYEILINSIKPGDICLIQFGHNDQKIMHLKVEEGYRENVLRYIKEIQEKQAIPVLVTSLARNSWRVDGTYNDMLEPYVACCKKISAECHIPLIDLHQYSMEWVLSVGREGARNYFYPSDYTHSNDYGAYLFASFIYSELAKQKFVEARNITPWQPPKQVSQELVKKHEKHFFAEQEGVFGELERPEEIVTREEGFDMVEKTMRFFTINVYNHIFEDVRENEPCAGIMECAWQNGFIPENMIENGNIYPKKELTVAEFIEILMRGYGSRKPLPDENFLKAAGELGIVTDKLSLQEGLTRQQALEFCKKIII